MSGMIPRGHAERGNWFRQLAHVVHLGRCTRFPFGDCRRHEESEYFTPKDNDIASVVIRWLEFEHGVACTIRTVEGLDALPPLDLVIKFTERHMLDLLLRRYSQTNPGNGPRYACAEHVKSQAGFDARRCADFIAIDCWPTGGIELHGHEVKVSRSDWLHELKQPDKAEAFKRYMDRWWLVVPDAKIVKPGELPEDWGLLVMNRRQQGFHAARSEECLRAKVQAPRLDPEPLPKEMLATLMRSTVKTAKRGAHEKFCTPPCGHFRRDFT